MIGFAELRQILPHRYPVLLVDRVDELVVGERLVARKAVTGNEPWYADLSDDAGPDQVAYPEVLVLESWCQAAGVLVNAGRPAVLGGSVMLLGGVSDIFFPRRVLPGDVLVHRVRVLRDRGDTMVLAGDALVDGDPVLSVGTVTTALRPADHLRARHT